MLLSINTDNIKNDHLAADADMVDKLSFIPKPNNFQKYINSAHFHQKQLMVSKEIKYKCSTMNSWQVQAGGIYHLGREDIINFIDVM